MLRETARFRSGGTSFWGLLKTDRDMNPRPGEPCPPRMSDGRSFTLYRPGCELVPPDMSSNQARAHLVANAEAMMRRNRERALHNGCSMACFDPSETTGTALPELSFMSCDARTCRVVPGAAGGLGMGRRARNGA